MGSDLSMMPPPQTQYRALKNNDTIAVYRYQPDAIYNFAHPDWIRTFIQTNFTEDFFRAVGVKVIETTLEKFPIHLTTSEMADIVSPKQVEYVGRHRKV